MIDLNGIESVCAPLRFFLEISKIPHGSGNTAALCDYLESFARERGLFCLRDGQDNVIIRKSVTEGFEDRPTVILQGHSDMVAAKRPDIEINMEKEGLSVYRDGDFLRACGTSLGADDGVALAYALAILDSSDLKHPELEVLFTSDEEVGLIGAAGLDASALRGRLLINIDSDEEGVFTVGCAGGVSLDAALPVTREAFSGKCYSLSLSGLLGGHSGGDIDKGRANAIKLLVKMLSTLGDIRISELSGGAAHNAIPKDASVTFMTVQPISAEKTAALGEIFSAETASESDAAYALCESSGVTPLSALSSAELLSLISDIPSGIVGMSADIAGLVETSLNIGTARLTEDCLTLGVGLRSSKREEKERLKERVTAIAKKHGASAECHGDYPEWEYKQDSYLREKMCELFEEMYGKAPKVITIHAGLECGILSQKIPGLDCVSIGPDNFCLHTPEEHLSLPSMARVFEYLKLLLERI